MKRLFNRLINQNIITDEQVSMLKRLQQDQGKLISDLIIENGFLSEEALKNELASVLTIPIFNFKDVIISPEVIKLISYEFAKKHHIFPVCIENNKFVLAMVNPLDVVTQNIIEKVINLQIKPLLSTKSEIKYLIEKFYTNKTEYNLKSFLKEIDSHVERESLAEVKAAYDLEKTAFNVIIDSENESQVVKLVNVIFGDAVKMRATDVHIDPQEQYVDIRFRVDGTLKSIIKVPNIFRASLVSRIKILTCLDIAETRASQDGRASIYVNNKKIDIRIAVIPTFYGEKISMRLLNKNEAKLDFSMIGLNEYEINIIKDAAMQPQGMILTTGPTGSGKTSTLYAALNFLRKHTNKHIVTIEDPIEYLLESVNQIQLNVAKNLTFSTGLKSILRLDPNVILVGEIRDRETADIAFRASLTGHLVLSTLHTNSAVATITRLQDIGLESYLIGSTLSLIIAQRLVKVICSNCISVYTPEPHILAKVRPYLKYFEIDTFFKGLGCKECNNTGYLKRTAIFEILKLNSEIKNLITQKASEATLQQYAQKNGLRTLVEAGMEKVALKITTLEEIVGVIETSSFLESETPLEVPEVKNRILKILFPENDLR